MNVRVLICLAEFFKDVLNGYGVKKIGKRVNNPADTVVKIEAGNMLKKLAKERVGLWHKMGRYCPVKNLRVTLIKPCGKKSVGEGLGVHIGKSRFL